jgi:hypothetical protein
MRQSFSRMVLPLMLGASPIVAQEFDLDLVFDEETLFEDVADESAPGGPDIRATLSFGASRLAGVTTDNVSLRFEVSDRYDLDRLGFLEWSGNFTLDDLGGMTGTSIGLDRIQLQNSAGNLSWKIGKFPIGWGEIEGVPVLDVLNAGISLATIGTATAELPGQWFASVDYFGGNNTISVFMGLDPVVAHAAPAVPGGIEKEFGLRAVLPLERGQLSLYAAQLVPQAGVVDLVSATSNARPYTLVGVSAYRAFGAVLAEFDLAAKIGLDRASATGLAPRNRIDAALGMEYAVSGTAQITASLAIQHWLEQDDAYFDMGPAGPVAANQTNASYLLTVTNTVMSGDLDLSLFLGGALDGNAQFAVLNAEFNVSDSLSLNASFSQIWASPASLLAPLDRSQSLAFEAKYFF